MLYFTKPEPFNADKLLEELAAQGFEVERLYGIAVEADGRLSLDLPEEHEAAVGAVVAAHTGEPSSVQQVDIDWRDRLQAELAWLENEIATAPAPGTTTNGNAVARLDALIQHQKRIDRDLIRLVRFLRDGMRDTED